MRFTRASSQYFDTGLTYAGGAFLLEGWFYLVDLSNNYGLFCIDDNGAGNNNRQAQIYVGTDGLLRYDVFTSACSGTTQGVSQGGTALAAGNWYYLEATWDGANEMRIRVRDVTGAVLQSRTAAATTVCASGAKRVTFGRTTQATNYLNGRLRNFYWYDGAYGQDANAALRRMFSANPDDWRFRTAEDSMNFYPLRDSTDTVNLLGSDGTIPNSATSEADIPAIPGSYRS